jgi:hypothetical protein
MELSKKGYTHIGEYIRGKNGILIKILGKAG